MRAAVKYILLPFLLAFGATDSFGQRMSVSTDLLGYLDFATINAEASYAMARHWSVTVSARYNPWTFNKGRPGRQVQHRQQCYAAGARYWLWHTYSGWWISGKLQYQEYNTGGLFDRSAEEGDRIGAGIGAGYAYMLHPHLNIEFGMGLWGGYGRYVYYSCPSCGLTTGKGEGMFLLPNDVMISLSYVF